MLEKIGFRYEEINLTFFPNLEFYAKSGAILGSLQMEKKSRYINILSKTCAIN